MPALERLDFSIHILHKTHYCKFVFVNTHSLCHKYSTLIYAFVSGKWWREPRRPSLSSLRSSSGSRSHLSLSKVGRPRNESCFCEAPARKTKQALNKHTGRAAGLQLQCRQNSVSNYRRISFHCVMESLPFLILLVLSRLTMDQDGFTDGVRGEGVMDRWGEMTSLRMGVLGGSIGPNVH